MAKASNQRAQTKEVTNLKMEKEKLFKLIVEQNAQIHKMEKDMEALLKENKQFQATCTST